MTSNPSQVINNLQARWIKHIFLMTGGYTSAQYAQFAPFIQTAHNSQMTVHPVCAFNATVTDSGGLSPVLLSNVLAQVLMYNTNNPGAQFDGMQIDIEGTNGAALLSLVQQVSVPSTMVFSAAVQPNEFYSNVESYYNSLLATTSLDVLIPMIYIMDDLGYSGGNLVYGFSLTGSDSISYKTTNILAKLPTTGQMMTGLSGYDYTYAVTKGGGVDWNVGGSGGNGPTMGSGTYCVPQLVQHYPLVSVAYQPITGVSTYRFNYSSTDWFDVDEMTPVGLGLSIAKANNAGTNAPHGSNYVGACSFLYTTLFDSTSERQAGLTLTNTTYPIPQVSLQVVSVSGNVAHLRVGLTNAYPSEQILGDAASAGVHLQLQGASFASADPGSFHAALAFDTSGNQLGSISGAPVLELRRWFFENLSAQQAQSGDIVVTAPAPFALQYRAWMTAKDSLCTDTNPPVPYVARSPDDIHYNAPSRFMTYATFATNLVVAPSSAYVGAVVVDGPVAWLRFSETNVVTVPSPFTTANLGTVGLAGTGVAAVTNNGFSSSILGGQPGALASSTDTALEFCGDTNRIIVPYNSIWNRSAPFSVELWVKGGANLCCPAASTDWTNSLGWLVYQGNLAQTSGNGWYFRVYGSGGKANAQLDMTVSPSAWYYIVGVYDGANALLYVNGSLAASTALSGTYVPNTSYPLTFGARADGGQLALSGFIDEPAFYTNALTAGQIAAHYAAATTNAAGYASQILALHPAGYWPFNDGFNPPVAANSGTSGAAFNGAYLNWSTTTPDFQAPAYAGLEAANAVLQVFGTNGQAALPPLNLNTNTVTFECWLKRNGDQPNYAGVLMHRDAYGTNACGLGFHGANNHLGYWWNDASSTYNWDSGLQPADGQWTYAALTISPSQAVISMYDGTTWSAATQSLSHANQAFAGVTRIGSDGGLSGRWFKGSIDEAAIYSSALSQTQLRNHALSAFGSTNLVFFTQLPVSQAAYAGASASFSSQVSGTPTISYQWKFQGANLLAATGLPLSFASVDYTNAGPYALAASNNYGGVLSPAATLTVLPPPSVTNLTYRLLPGGAGQALDLIWPSGTLYSASNVTGPWTPVSGASAPYYQVPIAPAAPSLFFKAE